MALKFKRWDRVSLKQPVIAGPVLKIDVDGDDVRYLVEYVAPDGETHRRYFAETDLELAPVGGQ